MPLGPVALRVPDYHRLRPNFPERSTRASDTTAWSYYPACASPRTRFGLFPGRSPLLGESLVYFLFLWVLRCFSSPGSPPYSYIGMTVLQTAGLSHSEILGSQVICTYPRLIAACHVLHRLREPRHPPDALTCFRLIPQTPSGEGGMLILSAVIEILTNSALFTV